MIGYDFEHGRIDLTAHPFASGAPGDVRITTRFYDDDPVAGVMATMHETGHAMYEMGAARRMGVPARRLCARHGIDTKSQSLADRNAGRANAAFLPVLARLLRETFGADAIRGRGVERRQHPPPLSPRDAELKL